ncbi:MAG: hypothetical protein NT027_11570 [Proteobacteria bacterium]|nr:hypothetical protein [Pseudomonadota bacterium]
MSLFFLIFVISCSRGRSSNEDGAPGSGNGPVNDDLEPETDSSPENEIDPGSTPSPVVSDAPIIVPEAALPPVEFLGGIASISQGAKSGFPAKGIGPGMLSSPVSVTGTNDGKIFVSDSANHRISRYSIDQSLSKYDFDGWIGRVYVAPTPSEDVNPECHSIGKLINDSWCRSGAAQGSQLQAPIDGQFKFPGGSIVVGEYLYTADTANHRVTRTHLESGKPFGWIGMIGKSRPSGGHEHCKLTPSNKATPGWCDGGISVAGSIDGALNMPRDVASDGQFLYVSDSLNHRISRYEIDSGAFAGWYGGISTSPVSGIDGCSGVTQNEVTPGFCFGGKSKSISTIVGGLKNPNGLQFLNGILYLADSGHQRIAKINIDNFGRAVLRQWIGRVSNIKPTSGNEGCATATIGVATPGWCDGGAPSTTSAFGDGLMSNPSDVAIGERYLFVSDTGNSRVLKYETSSGRFIGWIGRVATVPSKGDESCIKSSVGQMTPKWCITGRSIAGVGQGFLTTPLGLYLSNQNKLFVADSGSSAIKQYDADSGEFLGWIGSSAESNLGWKISSTAINLNGTQDINGFNFFSSGAIHSVGASAYVADTQNHRILQADMDKGLITGWIGGLSETLDQETETCSKVTIGSAVPNWCGQGVSKSGLLPGTFNSPKALFADDDFIYVADTLNHRIQRINRSSGSAAGWIGRVGSKPTAGGNACQNAVVGGATPGWCSGGSAKSGTGDGHFNGPSSIFGDKEFLYVGWVGRINSPPKGGAVGCSSSLKGQKTPGWCLGGAAEAGAMDLNFRGIRGIIADSDNHLFVADGDNHRIQRIDTESGEFLGWIGELNAASRVTTKCNHIHGLLLEWCLGGSSTKGNRLGAFNTPHGITLAGDFLLVADSVNNRMVRITQQSGISEKWLGGVQEAPTGDSAYCNSLQPGRLARDWCEKGLSGIGLGSTGFNLPTGVNWYSGMLHIVDSNNGRLVRIKINPK